MTVMRFIGRQREMQMLDRFYKSRKATLLILYGRRRVGKTALLTTWLDRQRIRAGLFWTAPAQLPAVQLRDFTHALLNIRGDQPPSDDYSFRNWDVALEELARLAEKARRPFVCVFDEFTHLVDADPSLASILQRVWDHRLSRVTSLRLVLTGSLIGVMENEVLSARAPLFGRATMQYRLRPLPFGHLIEWFPKWTPAERVAAYAVAGGIPAYLDLFAETGSLDEGLRTCIAPGSLTTTDAALVLSERVRVPLTYSTILATLAAGFHAWGDISLMSSVPETGLNSYLEQLEALDLIERRAPVLASRSARRSRYHVKDPFLRFYFRFVVPHRTLIEQGRLDEAAAKISPELRSFIGLYTFEELAREWVWAEGAASDLGFMPDEVGSYWTRVRGKPVQLDVVGVDKRARRLFIGETKWETGHQARGLLRDLVERSQRWTQVKAEGWTAQYALFAREGFTPAAIAEAESMKARLVSLPQLEERLVSDARRAQALPTAQIEY